MAQIRIAGLTEAVGTLRNIPPAMERSVILQMAQIAYDSTQRGAQRHTRQGGTGALLQSLFNRRTPTGGREVGHDTQRAPHAFFINAGTRPHIIEPKNKKALRWSGGGRFFFAKRVHHPGYRGDAYIIEAATESLRLFRSIVDQAMKEAS